MSAAPIAGTGVPAPVVSVIIPTYNRAHLLPRALDSVLAQDVGGLEVIVVDDGSTDNTAELFASRFHTVTYIQQANHGAAMARNHGIRVAHGEFIAFLDSDDVWLEGSLAAHLAVLRAHPELVMICGDFRNMPDQATGPWPTHLESRRWFRMAAHPAIADGVVRVSGFQSHSILEPIYSTSATIVRRHLLQKGPCFDPALRVGEDWDLWTRLGLLGPVAISSRLVFLRYLQDDNLTSERLSASKGEILLSEKYLHEPWPSPDERRFLRRRIATAWCDLGYAQRRGAETGDTAWRHYLRSLRAMPTFHAMKSLAGLVREAVMSPWRPR